MSEEKKKGGFWGSLFRSKSKRKDSYRDDDDHDDERRPARLWSRDTGQRRQVFWSSKRLACPTMKVLAPRLVCALGAERRCGGCGEDMYGVRHPRGVRGDPDGRDSCRGHQAGAR
ncbi:hypothetical protein MAPG_08607 [Magnaporthiopsis poae ATCC 64411]|uniref:Uncharacterized protein n=1 Tax=Magnaporthiopsis poae (strain ATCC 64411 / 73-15) TaxID=644358 RepID=A0A0C4E7T5_MAGP6|nr:hypothetical protein MAPG_08607 [Magnaporthiopsis poae ATCC 64411]